MIRRRPLRRRRSSLVYYIYEYTDGRPGGSAVPTLLIDFFVNTLRIIPYTRYMVPGIKFIPYLVYHISIYQVQVIDSVVSPISPNPAVRLYVIYYFI